jgi:16S rRNA (guanine527-N7)-methyltransferase
VADLTEGRIGALLAPYLADPLSPEILTSLRSYVALVLRWNGQTNLTAIREPEQLVQRQVGESLFAARLVPAEARTLMDFGSGGGFPGIPMQLVRPELAVTLAESQGKKAAFLREAVRTLGLASAVWSRRVEELPAGQLFDGVTMRAVDKTGAMLPVAEARVGLGGCLVRFMAEDEAGAMPGWRVAESEPIPLSRGSIVRLVRE